MRIFLLIILISLIFQSAYSEKAEVIHIENAKGTSVLAGDVSANDARQQALYKAWTNAIEKACGITISGFSSVKDGMFAGEYIEALSNGYIKSYEITDQRCDDRTKVGDTEFIFACTVQIKADVICLEGERDLSFSIITELDRPNYKANEELIITLQPSQDCYITIFNLTADGNVYILYPNEFMPAKVFEKDKIVDIPDYTNRLMGIHLRTAPLPGHTSDVEYIKVVATKTELPLDKWTENYNGNKILKNGVITLGEILASIPLHLRTEYMMQYIVSEE